MAKITHPTMGRGDVAGTTKDTAQSFVVDDASNNKPHNTIDEHIKKFESNNVHVQQDSVNAHDRGNLENLLFIGRLTKEINLFEHTFELGTMTNKEHNQMIKELYKFGDGADLFTIRILTLAHALRSIDNVLLEDMRIDGEFTNMYYKKMAVLDNMQLSLVEKLYDEYSKLVDESDKLGENEKIKK